MGGTHHALEDYGVLLCLPHIRAYIPAFDSDVEAIVPRLFEVDHPAYLRLGVSEIPPGMWPPAAYAAPGGVLSEGKAGVIVVAGPLWSAAFGSISWRFRSNDALPYGW